MGKVKEADPMLLAQQEPQVYVILRNAMANEFFSASAGDVLHANESYAQHLVDIGAAEPIDESEFEVTVKEDTNGEPRFMFFNERKGLRILRIIRNIINAIIPIIFPDEVFDENEKGK